MVGRNRWKNKIEGKEEGEKKEKGRVLLSGSVWILGLLIPLIVQGYQISMALNRIYKKKIRAEVFLYIIHLYLSIERGFFVPVKYLTPK